jgi:hypothetical protein
MTEEEQLGFALERVIPFLPKSYVF